MKNGVGNKRLEDSALARLGRSFASVFKTAKRDVEKPEPPGPSINPEALTAQKREWIDSQAAQVHQALATWPEHLFEHFFVVGLPPDVEVTRIAEDLWAQEVRQRHDGGEQNTTAAAADGSSSGGGSSNNSMMAGDRDGGEARGQYDKAPRPAYDARVLFRHPATKTAPLKDQELVDLCFPHKVTPVKLRRSPSMSSLHEVVYGRHAAARDDQCFIFLLKVGSNLPLYGVCCAVPEMLHRPPHLARHLYPAFRMPFRSVMIAAPRVYCLLSHYPFFDLHFQVLNVILGMERLHRTIDFNAELDFGSAVASAAATGGVAANNTTVAATAAAAARTADPGGGGSGAVFVAAACVEGKGPELPEQSSLMHPQTLQQKGAIRLSSRCYCHDCANAILDMYPGLLQPREPDLLRHSKSNRQSMTGLLLEMMPSAAAAVAATAGAGRGPTMEAVPGGAALAAVRTHGSVRRVSDPGSAGLTSPPLDLGTVTVADLAMAVELRQNRRFMSNGGGGGGGLAAVLSPSARVTSDGGWYDLTAGPPGLAEMECCQACGRMMGWAPIPRPLEEMPTVPEQSPQKEVTDALESALDKLAFLPRAVAATVSEAAAAAAAVVLRRVSPGPMALAAAGVELWPVAPQQLNVIAPGDRASGNGDVPDTVRRPSHAQPESHLSSDMETPNATLPSSASATARALVAAPAEAASTLASIVRDSLKALGSGAIGASANGNRQRRGAADCAGVCDADTATVEQADGLHTHRGPPEQTAFVNVHVISPPQSRKSLHSHAEGPGGAAAAPPSGAQATEVAAKNSGPHVEGCLDSSVMSQGGVAPGESLVQQLMRSVMAPMSPAQAPLDASEPYSPTGHGQGLPPGVHISIQSPVLPASPRQDAVRQPQQQQQLVSSRGRPQSHTAQTSFTLLGGTATAAATTAGYNYSWSFLQRLGRRSQCRSAGGDLSPGREDKVELRGGELQEVSTSPAAPAAAAAPPSGRNTSAAPSYDRSESRTDDDSRQYRTASAFATAIEVAADVERQLASSPRTPSTFSTRTDVEEMMATLATRVSEGAWLGPQLPLRYGDAVGAANGGRAGTLALPPRQPRKAGSHGGHSPETGSQYASMSHSGPTSRRVTAPGDGLQGHYGDDDHAVTKGAGVAVPCGGGSCSEANGAHQGMQRSQGIASTALALFAAAPHLLAEQSGFSAHPSDASFYSAEGPEEDATPRDELCGGSAFLAEAMPSLRPSPFQSCTSAHTLSVSMSASALQVPDIIPGGRGLGQSQMFDSRTSVELPPAHLYGGNNVAPKLRGPTSGLLSFGGSLLSTSGIGDGGGGAVISGRGSLFNAASLVSGTSRLARTSVSAAPGPGDVPTVANSPSPQPPPASPMAATAASPLQPTQECAGANGGCTAAAAATPQPALVPMPTSGGMVSPPPAGVTVTSDMTHHFSPRHALDQLYSHPLVHPGEQMTLRFGGVATLQFTRPVLARRFTVLGPPRAIQAYAEAELAEGLQHWTTAVLCRSLSIENLLLVLTAVLLERQVVVFCPHISVLSACVLGLLPLLRPFCWQSLLLPVTPVSMMGFLEAPVPFVLGVQYKTSDVMARCSNLIRVNVYKDQVKNAGAPLPVLPGLKRLMAALASHHALVRRRLSCPGAGGGGGGVGGGGSSVASGLHGPAAALGALLTGAQADMPQDGGRSLRTLSCEELAATSSLLSIMAHHLSSLCGDLRPHVITNVGLSKRTGILMKESLLEVIPPKDKPFVRQFVDTQMFSVWSDALISADFEGSFVANS